MHNCTIIKGVDQVDWGMLPTFSTTGVKVLIWPVHIWPQNIAWLRSPTKIQHPLSNCVADVVRRGRLRWFGHLERKSVDDWVSACRGLGSP